MRKEKRQDQIILESSINLLLNTRHLVGLQGSYRSHRSTALRQSVGFPSQCGDKWGKVGATFAELQIPTGSDRRAPRLIGAVRCEWE